MNAIVEAISKDALDTRGEFVDAWVSTIYSYMSRGCQAAYELCDEVSRIGLNLEQYASVIEHIR